MVEDIFILYSIKNRVIVRYKTLIFCILNNGGKKVIADEMNTKLEFQNKKQLNYISVIIPVYKDFIGLEETLKSLKQQTIPEEDYEIIVANDGADKRITKICDKYNVKMVSISPNQGSYNARNRAIELSKGEYLAFVDSDITVVRDWLGKGKKALERFDYVAGDVIIDKSKINNTAHYYEYYYEFPINHYMHRRHFGVTANLFVKRKVFEELGGFDKRLRSGGDLEFGNRVYISRKFKQVYKKEVRVIHPPRGYKALIKKMKRVTEGHIKLSELYPNRFQKPRLLENLHSISVHSPHKRLNEGHVTELKMFLFASLLRLVRCYHLAKHR